MNQLLIEDTTISNDMMSCLDPICKYESYSCLKTKILNILKQLRLDTQNNSVETDANQIFQAFNDVLREILKVNRPCNTSYKLLLNKSVGVMKEVVYKTS